MPTRRPPRPSSGQNTVVEASARTRHARELFAPLGPTYDRYARLLSFGQDPRWRSFLVSRIPRRRAARARRCERDGGRRDRARARRVQAARSSGSTRAPRCSRRDANGSRDAGLSERIELRDGRAEALPFADGEFDALTFTYLLRYVDDVPATLRELVRVVRPGGTVAMLEFGLPRGAGARSGSSTYGSACRQRGPSSRPAGARSEASSARASAASGATGRSRASSTRGARPASPMSTRAA